MRSTTYQSNDGLRKVCQCPRRRWPRCPHSYNFNYRDVRLSLDAYAGRHLSFAEASTLASELRIERDEKGVIAPRFKRATPSSAPAASTSSSMTVEQLGERYFAQARNRLTGEPLNARERANWEKFASFVVDKRALRTLAACDVTAEHVRQFYETQATLRPALVANGKSTKGKQRASYARTLGGPVAANRTGDRAATVFKWAASHSSLTGVERSPFRDAAGDRVVAKYGEIERDRRLEAGEEDALIAAATPHLRLCIIGALESTFRIGELLALRWRQVDLDAGCIRLVGRSQRAKESTKTRKDRLVPISARMRAVLEFLQIGPDGKPHHGTAYVFGDSTTGEKRKSLSSAWITCRLRACGFTGQIREDEQRKLTGPARAALRDFDLRWHDLRRESASKHLDRGMRLVEVKEMLGHASLSTTSRYVKPRQGWVQEAAKRIDAHPDSRNELQKIAEMLQAQKEARIGDGAKSVN